MTADRRDDIKAEHDADIKAEKDAEKVYQDGLKADKAAEVPYVRPLERPHHSLTEACAAWDKSVADEVAACAPVAKTKDDCDDEDDPKKGKGKGRHADEK